MPLTDNEKRDAIKLLESDRPLPDKYRFLLFEDKRELELVWNGKTSEVTNTVLPFQVIEQVDEPRSEKDVKLQESLFDVDTRGRQLQGWTNKLIWGDNKLILSSLKNGPLRDEIDRQGGIKLVYIDPPFDVGADFTMNIEVGAQTLEKKAGVLEELAYRDTWGRGTDSFISMIFERLTLIERLLADDGTIVVHCDWRVNSLLRLALDEIFGPKKLINELVWHYRTFQGQAHGYFAKKHDTLLWYSKGTNHTYNEVFDTELEDTIDAKRWANYIDESGAIRGGNMPTQDSRFVRYLNKWRKTNGREPTDDDIVFVVRGQPADSVWDLKGLDPKSGERVGYPTQKPEELVTRIVEAATNTGDLVADFFAGSGTTLAVAEKLGRKWIGSDLGKFAIHTTRKRLIAVQRELKVTGEEYRAFELLNLGKYERQHYVGMTIDVNDDLIGRRQQQKDADFEILILRAYAAEPVTGFRTLCGKKSARMTAIGPVNLPVSRLFAEAIIGECREKLITKVDLLAFEFEMGLFPNIQEVAKESGIDLQLKYIPREVFDKRAIDKGQVVFHDVGYLEAKAHVRKRTVSIELTDYSVGYNQDSVGEVTQLLKPGGSRIVVENGQIIRVVKRVDGGADRELLTKKWSDWVDYWAVDFNFESKKEIIATTDPTTGEISEIWTGEYIFENEWQAFRTKNDRTLDLSSVGVELPKGKHRVAVKVVDIFGNDTMKVIDVNV